MKIIKLSAALIFAAVMVSCNVAGNSSTTTESGEAEKVSPSDYSGIAYIRMDTLIHSYGMFIDLSDEFNKKGKSVEADLTQRSRSFEKEAIDFQDKVQKNLVTRYQAQTMEEGLQKKQQDLVAFRDNALASLQQEEAVMMNKISTVVMDFLKTYNAEKKYSVIFQSTANNPILIADPALDITEDVLKKLNEQYLAGKDVKK